MKNIYEMSQREHMAHIRHKKHKEIIINWIIEKIIVLLLIFLIICFIGSPEFIVNCILGA